MEVSITYCNQTNCTSQKADCECQNKNETAKISAEVCSSIRSFYDEINDFLVRKQLKMRFLNETKLLSHKNNQGQT